MFWRLHGPNKPQIHMFYNGYESWSFENIIKHLYFCYSWCLELPNNYKSFGILGVLGLPGSEWMRMDGQGQRGGGALAKASTNRINPQNKYFIMVWRLHGSKESKIPVLYKGCRQHYKTFVFLVFLVLETPKPL